MLEEVLGAAFACLRMDLTFFLFVFGLQFANGLCMDIVITSGECVLPFAGTVRSAGQLADGRIDVPFCMVAWRRFFYLHPDRHRDSGNSR